MPPIKGQRQKLQREPRPESFISMASKTMYKNMNPTGKKVVDSFRNLPANLRGLSKY